MRLNNKHDIKNHKESMSLYKYFSKEINDVELLTCDLSEGRICVNFLDNEFSAYDRPDFYAIKDNILFIMEHFGFDSSVNDEGSQMSHKVAKIQESFNDIIKNTDKESLTIHNEIKLDANKNYLFDNCVKIFDKHYIKIDHYIDNLKAKGIFKENYEIKICFFMEDNNHLGNEYQKGNKLIHLNLLKTKQFLNYLENKTRVDYILYGCSIMGQDKIFFISTKNLKLYRKNQIDINDVSELVFDNYMSTSFMFTIPKMENDQNDRS